MATHNETSIPYTFLHQLHTGLNTVLQIHNLHEIGWTIVYGIVFCVIFDDPLITIHTILN